MKKLLALVLFLFSSGAVNAYEGGWDTSYYDEVGRELLILGDNTDDTYRGFSGTRQYCGAPGTGYANMRNIINAEYDQITWWIDADCGSIVHVCVENSHGDWGCSSYIDRGWGW